VPPKSTVEEKLPEEEGSDSLTSTSSDTSISEQSVSSKHEEEGSSHSSVSGEEKGSSHSSVNGASESSESEVFPPSKAPTTSSSREERKRAAEEKKRQNKLDVLG